MALFSRSTRSEHFEMLGSLQLGMRPAARQLLMIASKSEISERLRARSWPPATAAKIALPRASLSLSRQAGIDEPFGEPGHVDVSKGLHLLAHRLGKVIILGAKEAPQG
jgi:hypothetical protein